MSHLSAIRHLPPVPWIPGQQALAVRSDRRKEVAQMAAKKSSGGKNHRSAITGRFVTAGTAKRSPKTTVSEKRK